MQVYVQQASSGAGVILSHGQCRGGASEYAGGGRGRSVRRCPRCASRGGCGRRAGAGPAVTVAARSLGTVSEMEEPIRLRRTVAVDAVRFPQRVARSVGAGTGTAVARLPAHPRDTARPGVSLSGLGASRVAIALLQSAILLGLRVLSFGVDFGNPVAVAVPGGLPVIAGAAGMLLAASRRRPGRPWPWPCPGIVLGMLGGTMWPLSVVGPDVASVTSPHRPGRWMPEPDHQRRRRSAGIATELAVLTGFAVALSALAVWALGRHARTGR